MTKRKDINLRALTQKLITQRQEILDNAKRNEEARRPVKLDQTSVGRLSRMDAIQLQAISLETERRRQFELQHINNALERIKKDEFGECLICGEYIKAKRLEFNPSVSVCVDCAE